MISVWDNTIVRSSVILALLTIYGPISSHAYADEDVPTAAAGPFSAGDVAFFEEQVRPILAAHCFKCHGGETKIRGGLRLTQRAGLLAGGDSGPAVSLDDSRESLLLEAVNYESYEMPPSGKLPAEKIEILTRWLKKGIPWTPGDKGPEVVAHKGTVPQVDEEAKSFWSFQPVQRPEAPSVNSLDWVKNPIDAFILARLEENGLRPAPPADRVELIRRAYYDLIGLPPSPEEVDAFLHDDSPDAFEKVADRLLESPHYGERWARHWLDLVRYAETNSYERDGAKPNVWRYRDYVIRSLNEDKPYDQFVKEQLAGDELDEVTSDGIIATGFYRLGIWQDEPVDRVQELYEDLDDMASTTAQAFLGLTLNCARCHDHKLDPIPQRDYYRFLAFFHGIDRNVSTQRDIGTEEQLRQQQEQIDAHRRQVEQNNQRIAAIEKLVVEDFEPVEHEEFKHEQHRIPIVKKRVPRLLSEERFQEYVDAKKRQRVLKKFKPSALDQALCVTEIGREARDTFVLIRGSAHARGEAVEPGFPSVLGFPDPEITATENANSSGRRRALAEWIASGDNPLSARVIANRIWQHHFGRGIVRSPNNFGFQGTPPTHPELLDWLAAELINGDWRLKQLHRKIMLASAYQMSSRARDDAMAADPQNNLFWRFDMRRLSAEEVRDSILAVNGSLNRELYGPSIYPIIPDEVKQGQSRPGSGWHNSSPEQRARRSIYIHVKRSLLVPMMAAFDVADADATCPVRFVTTQPTQSLGMINGAFTNEQARVFADYVRRHAGNGSGDRVELALQRTLQRRPTDDEIDRGVDLLEELEKQHDLTAKTALDYYCLVILNLNEFIYLD